MRRFPLVAALGLLLLPLGGARVALAQAPTRPPASPTALPAAAGELRGRVVAADGNVPVDRAAVAVRSRADSVLVAGAIAGEDGAFRIRGLRPGAYVLRVTAIGFTPRRQEFAISPAAPTHDAGAIALARVAVTLTGVQVTAERAAMTIEPDRNAYRAKDVAPAAANASDVLDAVPSVQVDGDGKVSLRGNENVAVQINGRPSPLHGAQLAAFLKSLPASTVERVEVVPNPSAKYDPEGMAGIINIVLKQNTDIGLSAGVNAQMAETDRYNASGNVGYQSGPLALFTSLGFNADDRAIIGVNDRERYDALGALLSVTNQEIDGRQGGRGQNLSANADYRLTPRDVLSSALTINHRDGSDDARSAYTELDASQTPVERYGRPRVTDTKGLLIDYTMALKRTFEPRKHELSTELRFNRAHDEDRTALWKLPAGGSPLERENDDTDALTKQLNAQADYTRPLGARFKLETGYKGTARWLDRDFFVEKDAAGSGDWVRSDLSNAFQFDETVHAGYGVLSQTAGKVQLQGGLRAEHASRTFALDEPAQKYPYSYTSLFPSGVVTYNRSEKVQLKASYSRRIRRPGTQELNPFPSFFDVQNVFLGNPRLKPEYTDAIELGLTRTWKLGSLQLSPFYRHTTDIIRVAINTADTVEGREVTSVSFENLATSDSWGSDLNGQLRLGPRFNGLASFNVFKMVTDGGSTSSLGSNAVTWSARLNATTQLSPTTTVQAAYFYRAPMNIERGRFAAVQGTNVSVRRKIYGDRAVVGVRVNDPFNTNRFRVVAGDDNVTQLTARSFGVRSTWLTFQYSYGQAPKVREQRPPEQEGRTGFP